ncbi:MAG: YidC/Oxa1 family membrane protein insertase [Oscillospiraceae bacterium]
MSIITVPFSWLLLKLYDPMQNYGIAIIMFALIVKLILLPFQVKSKRSMMRTASLTPILKELEKKHGGNKQKYQMEVSKLYQEEKINPMSGCIWTLIPFPILIALYSVVRAPLTNVMGLTQDQITLITEKITSYGVTLSGGTYRELEIAKHISSHYDELHALVPQLLDLNYNFLGINLCEIPKLNFFSSVDWSNAAVWGPALGLFLIPFISAFLSWVTMKVSSANNVAATAPEQAGMMKSMNLVMPLMSVYICFIMPAAMGIYWIANSVFAIAQELVMNKYFKKVLDKEQAERNARMQARLTELEQKREETQRKREDGTTTKNKNTSKRKLESQNRVREEERRAAEKAAAEKTSGEQKDVSVSQVGKRRYARGRAYDPERYGDAGEVSNADSLGEDSAWEDESADIPENDTMTDDE